MATRSRPRRSSHRSASREISSNRKSNSGTPCRPLYCKPSLTLPRHQHPGAVGGRHPLGLHRRHLGHRTTKTLNGHVAK
jgi:hypothetical protein